MNPSPITPTTALLEVSPSFCVKELCRRFWYDPLTCSVSPDICVVKRTGHGTYGYRRHPGYRSCLVFVTARPASVESRRRVTDLMEPVRWNEELRNQRGIRFTRTTFIVRVSVTTFLIYSVVPRCKTRSRTESHSWVYHYHHYYHYFYQY